MKVNRTRSEFPAPDRIETWESVVPDEWILRKLLESENLNVLMITGRSWDSVVKSAFSFSIIRTYCLCYDWNIHLLILGQDQQQLVRHRHEAESVMRFYGISDLVKYVFNPVKEEILAYYLACDAMLCLEESEDMEVPILLAQYFHLPILGQENSFTSEYVGRNQLLLSDDPAAYAAGLHLIRQNQDTARFLGNTGRAHYDFLKSKQYRRK